MKNTFLPTSLNLTINICRFVSRSIISWSELEKKYILKKLKHKSKKATKKKKKKAKTKINENTASVN